MAIFGNRSGASLRNYIDYPLDGKIRACSDNLSNALSGRPHQLLQPRFTALSFRSIFMSWWFGCRSFIKHSPWTVCFLLFMWNKLRIFTETKKLQAKVLNSKCRAILVCKLLQNMSFDGLTFLTDHQIIWTILTGILIGLLQCDLWEYRACWRHCCFENWK